MRCRLGVGLGSIVTATGLLLALAGAGCATEPKSAPAPHVEVLPDLRAPLGSRGTVIAAARRIEAAAAREQPEDRSRMLVHAGKLMERLWRREHIEDDHALAMKFFAEAEKGSLPSACEAALARGLLEAELARDPAKAYLAAHAVRLRAEKLRAAFGRECLLAAELVTRSLQAFKPFPAVLLDLERRLIEEASSVAKADAAPPVPRSSAAPDHSASLPPAASADSTPRVIEPEGGLSADDLRTPSRITRIERYGAADSSRVVIYTNQPARFHVGRLAGGINAERPRIFVDIENASYEGQRELKVGGLVERVRVGKHASATRVVLDLARDAQHRVFYLPEPFRLVVDVGTELGGAVVEGATPVSAELEAGPRSIRRVVLDPGHGGHDPGAVGPSGLREKDVTLDVAHRAAPLIARELGIATLLTRDDDAFVALDERTARANAFRADLFVSIHCNASEDGATQGVMTFVLDDSRDALAAHIAARENAASPAAAAELAAAMRGLQDRGNLRRSSHFAELLQRASLASLTPHYPGISDLGVRRAGFYVLAGAQMPASLFELSFISHPTGEAWLNTGDYRQRVADSIVNAVRAYRDGH